MLSAVLGEKLLLCAGDGKPCQLLRRYSSTGRRPQQASSQRYGANGEQCLHGEEATAERGGQSGYFRLFAGHLRGNTQAFTEITVSILKMFHFNPDSLHFDQAAVRNCSSNKVHLRLPPAVSQIPKTNVKEQTKYTLVSIADFPLNNKLTRLNFIKVYNLHYHGCGLFD